MIALCGVSQPFEGQSGSLFWKRFVSTELELNPWEIVCSDKCNMVIVWLDVHLEPFYSLSLWRAVLL